MTPARLLARLKQEPLGTLDKVATGADRSVAATFAASYEDLEDTHRRVLVALAACARLTTENVVARVVGLADDVAGDVLADLAECSLIDPVEASRWTMHDVVRLFVRAQPGIRQADEAHLAFAKEHVAAHQDPRDWQAMEAAMAEVLAAVDRLLDASDFPKAWQLAGQAITHLAQRGRHGELIERYEQLVAGLPEKSEARADVLGNLGICYQDLGDLPMAIEHHHSSMVLHEKLGMLQGQAENLGNLGICYREQGKIPKAIEHHQRALAIETNLRHVEGQADDLGNLGNCYRSQGKVLTAIKHHRHSLDLNKKMGRLHGEANALGNLGACYRDQGNIPKAIRHHQRALQIDVELGRLEGQAIHLHNLGDCYQAQPDFPRALDCYQRSLALCRSVGIPEGHRRIREILATLARLTPPP